MKQNEKKKNIFAEQFSRMKDIIFLPPPPFTDPKWISVINDMIDWMEIKQIPNFVMRNALMIQPAFSIQHFVLVDIKNLYAFSPANCCTICFKHIHNSQFNDDDNGDYILMQAITKLSTFFFSLNNFLM